jgi:hypothetical protein
MPGGELIGSPTMRIIPSSLPAHVPRARPGHDGKSVPGSIALIFSAPSAPDKPCPGAL